MRRTSRGFTLTEILIVVAVLMILAAFLLPVLGNMREKGRQSTCQSNLKQIFLAVQQYIQDNDSRPPSLYNWRGATTSYIKNADIFRCPSLPESIKRSDGVIISGEYNFYVGFLNSLVIEKVSNSSKQDFVGINEAVLLDASKIFVSGDVGIYGPSRQVPMPRQDACGVTMGNGKPDYLQTVSTIHNGGGNHLFYDGHVKWLTPENFVQSLCDAAKYLQPPFRADAEHMK